MHAGVRGHWHYGWRVCYRRRSALDIAFSGLLVMIWIQIGAIQKSEYLEIFPILLKLLQFNKSNGILEVLVELLWRCFI